MRSLASIRTVDALLPIEGADKIEIAQIGGWNVVVKKGEFSQGVLAVYFEIDSFLPAEHPAFEFLAKDAKERDGVKRIRLKTIRLRKQLSQGLLLPLGAFPELSKSVLGLRVLKAGDDVTELLNVEKYEPPEEVSANGGPADQRSRSSAWPFFLQKTDQERVQNCISQVAKSAAAHESFEVTIKLDGSSMTVFALRNDSPYFEEAFSKRAEKYEADHIKSLTVWGKVKYWAGRAFGKPAIAPDIIFGVCSRNREVDILSEEHFAQYARKHELFDKVKRVAEFAGSVAFQGELIAPSIQSNYEKVSEPAWYVYDVYRIDSQSYTSPTLARWYTQEAGLKYVPTISLEYFLAEEADSIKGRDIADKLLAVAEGPGMNEGVKREGIVFKSNSTPFSFKVISNSYLEKKG